MSLKMTRRRALLASVAGAAWPSAALAHAPARARPAYRDSSLGAADRARDLVGRMTLEEKVAQMRCMWSTKPAFLDADKLFSADKAARVIGQGIGQIARPSDIRGYPEWDRRPFRSIAETVELVNAIQRFLVERTRLGIPALFHDELAHGLLANAATIFPNPTALGSTWDPDLIEAVFTVAARQARLRGTTVALTPVVDLLRDPRYGRAEEFFGEDPCHVAAMGVAAVRGLQGRQRPLGPERVFATLKHFVHAVPQGGLNIAPADIGERALREAFLVPFARIVATADPAAIMPSYNELNGVPSHANVELLQATGRRRLGFRGVYFSDYEGIGNLADHHHVAGDKAEAAVLAVNAGVAADLPEGASYAHLPELVRAGRLSEAQLDDSVLRILTLKFEAGLFERPYLDTATATAATRRPQDVALARTAAQKAIVLLKNDGALPLTNRPGLRLAVIGPNAVEPLFGGYSGENDQAVGLLAGLRAAAGPGLVIEHAEGVWITPPNADGRHLSFSPQGPVPEADDARRIAEAVAVAQRADVIVLALGDTPALTREAVDISLPGDRSTLGLWGRQDALVEAIAATGKPVVAVLINGRPLATPRLAAVANALVEAWYPGQEGGHALADILFGKVSPGGKLPVSIPRAVGELPAFYNRHPSADLNTYIEGPRKPLFPFGHGLSYTTFALSPPRLRRSRIAVGEPAELAVTVTNTGGVIGDEVVQVYLRDEVSSVPRPVLELKAFRRVTLAPGETRELSFVLTPDDLAFWDAAMQWTVEPGDFVISAGSSSASLQSARLTVTAT
ncbi:glycoside hydrolase family 3 N-terminal domain-containing protein [Novosphingobium sp.]|uniref:glycoside hydrolase family 3 N-terminal domain-containing protein n=1 Tax=Novosphingobium sp. TaxID=1874826 RepID=UPI00261D6642|nr:glycoside hydrolase family 3 N-terminal domain-containing protein [Novosphingobium sp.]